METYIMTGATSGIGYQAAKKLISRNKKVHLLILGRNKSVMKAIQSLKSISSNISSISVDLNDILSIHEAIKKITDQLNKKQIPPISKLILNAGVHLDNSLHMTENGYEKTFGINVIANHILISGIHKLLEKNSKIIVTVSDAHFGDIRHTGGTMPKPYWYNLEKLSKPGAFPKPESVLSGRRAYTTSKLGGIYLVHEWSRKLPNNINIISYNPSLVINTGLARNAGGALQWIMNWLIPPLSLTSLVDKPYQAGEKLYNVITDKVYTKNGDYIHKNYVSNSSKESYNIQREKELWTWLDNESSLHAEKTNSRALNP